MARIERESINFKLPKPLADALRKVARDRNTTATDLVIEGLHHVLGSVPGIEDGVETRLAQLEEQLNHLANSKDGRVDTDVDNRLSLLEQKLETQALQLAKIEGVIATLGQRSYTNNRRQAFIAIASIVRTKVVEHALWRPVNNQRHPDICGCDF